MDHQRLRSPARRGTTAVRIQKMMFIFTKKMIPSLFFFVLLPLLLGPHHQFVLLGYIYGNTSESSQLSRSGLWRGCVQRQYIHKARDTM